jgi:adenosylcobinamide-phosphate synthase
LAALVQYFYFGGFDLSVLSVLIALCLDFTLGDPSWNWHPVRVLGRQISYIEPLCRALPINARAQGFVFAVFNIVIFIVPVAAVSFIFSRAGNLASLVDGILLYFALGGTCLAREVIGLSETLEGGGTVMSREKLRLLVSRDVDSMDERAMVSSAIETLSENFSDSAVATLFYAALGGPVLAWIHRISNTLDAMVGYRTEQYADFGCAAAKLDDALNFIPARLSVLITALASYPDRFPDTLRCAQKYGNKLSSPNSGYPIAAFAGALGVRLCGPVSYFGVMKDKPFIGEGRSPDIFCLKDAIILYWNSYALASVAALLFARVMRV